MADPLFNMTLDPEDRALLDACAEREKLSRADIMRRALREYAARLGVTLEQRPKPKRKK